MGIAERVHHDVRQGLNGFLVASIRIFVKDEKDIHEVASCAEMLWAAMSA